LKHGGAQRGTEEIVDRARVERVKRAVLEGKVMPVRAPPRGGWVDWTGGVAFWGTTVAAAGVVWTVTRFTVLAPVWSGAMFGFAIFFVVLGIVAASGWKQRRDRARVMSVLGPRRGRVCPRCHYPLAELPEMGECPECGTLYTHREVVELWVRTYGLKTDWLDGNGRGDGGGS
jgi:hypothetical protein